MQVIIIVTSIKQIYERFLTKNKKQKLRSTIIICKTCKEQHILTQNYSYNTHFVHKDKKKTSTIAQTIYIFATTIQIIISFTRTS